MAKAASKDEGKLRVRFVGKPGPPARLVADEVVIEAGKQGELPAALARELAGNDEIGLVLLDEDAPAAEEAPSGDLPGVQAHVNPAEEPAEEE